MENGAQLENSSTINIIIGKHLSIIYKTMKINFILIFLITDVNARRSSSRSSSSSRSTSGLNTSSIDDPFSDVKPKSTSSRRCDSFMSQEEMNSYFYSSRIHVIDVLGNGQMPPDGVITHCLRRRKPKKTKREKPKKTRKIESKDKPGIGSLTKKNLRTQLMRQDSSKPLQTSNCNSPYKCNGFNENWFIQSNDINLKLSLMLIILILI